MVRYQRAKFNLEPLIFAAFYGNYSVSIPTCGRFQMSYALNFSPEFKI